jgi:hypothetical protein
MTNSKISCLSSAIRVKISFKIFVILSENALMIVVYLMPVFGLQRLTTPKSVSELYRPSDRRLSAELVPSFEDRRCHVVTALFSTF